MIKNSRRMKWKMQKKATTTHRGSENKTDLNDMRNDSNGTYFKQSRKCLFMKTT